MMIVLVVLYIWLFVFTLWVANIRYKKEDDEPPEKNSFGKETDLKVR